MLAGLQVCLYLTSAHDSFGFVVSIPSSNKAHSPREKKSVTKYGTAMKHVAYCFPFVETCWFLKKKIVFEKGFRLVLCTL